MKNGSEMVPKAQAFDDGGGGGGGVCGDEDLGDERGEEEGPPSSLCGATTLFPRLSNLLKLAEALAMGDIPFGELPFATKLDPPDLGMSILT